MEKLSWLCAAAEGGLEIARIAIRTMGQQAKLSSEHETEWDRRQGQERKKIVSQEFHIGHLKASGEFYSQLREAAVPDNADAEVLLALIGDDEQLRKAAGGGARIAARMLGGFFEEGRSASSSHVPKALDQAEEYYRIAARLGDAVAQYEVGRTLVRCYLNGLREWGLWWEAVFHSQGAATGKLDHAAAIEAVEWYSKAADQGHAQSRYQLAALFALGIGVEMNKERAALLMRLAANQGYPNAQYALGAMHAAGDGVAKDRDEAARWYAKAAEGGQERADRALEYFSFKGNPLLCPRTPIADSLLEADEVSG